ncbi:3-hydroxyacyl-CoA dehydrogenase family protein [Rhodospirillaceae bacterium KN72]|uniref:3-hydroxyacyl-CoA dehydrogenase family protein n=1 Tax=Pacificispira spongiicola TaxID=2729598 RepID=A0A7Y0E236_9PROT|nr:3-hydroxyacyl-CoA dehydrogenase family protein [Pacificispira spongiicola]NMM45827.1 3-hydroxyacyl-CoA dehydrogenase family protein [Pacificispira spongiicola]
MTFSKVGIIGAGTMGSGIATSLGQQGVAVVLVDTTDAAVERGKGAAKKFYDRAAEKGKMTAEDAAAATARISTSTDLAALSACDLIIEAIFEEQSVKEDLFARLNPHLKPETVVATNTSALQVSDLAEAVDNPSRFLGLHYFNPAAINPIVEVVKGEKTDDAIYQRCIDFCRATAKKPIPCKDRFGFAINRFFVPYGNEAVRLLDEGVGTPAQIDRVAQDCLGVAAGPFLVMNLVKPKIMFHAQRNLGPHGAFYTLAKTLADKGDTDYEFEIGEDAAGSADADAVIADRLRAATFFPVLQEIDEDVATPADIDMGAGLALRFGKAPCELMDSLGADETKRIVSLVTEQYGHAMPASIAKVGSLRG